MTGLSRYEERLTAKLERHGIDLLRIYAEEAVQADYHEHSLPTFKFFYEDLATQSLEAMVRQEPDDRVSFDEVDIYNAVLELRLTFAPSLEFEGGGFERAKGGFTCTS